MILIQARALFLLKNLIPLLPVSYCSLRQDKFFILKLHSWLSPLLIGMGVTLVIQMLLSWLRQYYLIKLKLTLAIKESGKFLWHVLKLPMTFFSQRLVGDISNRISLNNEIANVISSDFTEVIINSIMA